MSERRDPAWMWTRYWRGGHGECCTASEPFDLTDFWRAHFETFAAGAALLDLATGGGQVAGVAASPGRGFTIDGVDIADLSGVDAAPGLRLIGGVRLEALPFADAAYDGVVSQFGIEYGERDAALREAVRVLKPGGRGRFVMHHVASAITAASAARLSLYRTVMGDGAPFRAGERLFTAYRDGAARPAIDAAESAFAGAVLRMRGRLGLKPADPNVAEVANFLADLARAPERYDPADALARLKAAEEEAEAWRLRLDAQQRAALSGEDVEAVRRYLGVCGAEAGAAETLTAPDGAVLAWALGFRKKA